MKIGIITPAPPGSNYGNRVTALRWARILRKLGHQVSISQEYTGQQHDLLLALHARRSASSVLRFHRTHPNAPIIVALTGTDLYRDLQLNGRMPSLEVASRIVVLQPLALKELAPPKRKKVCVIYQSVERKPVRARVRLHRTFDVCFIGHLRPVKDPFRAALATRLLPPSSQIRVRQIGRAMTSQMLEKARREAKTNPRFHWLGELPRARALRALAASDLCVISSRMEGGANVLSEAIVAAVPVLASRIDGNIGILGADYPGLFAVGDTRQLAQLMTRAETDSWFLSVLKTRGKKLAGLFERAREEEAWECLIDELT